MQAKTSDKLLDAAEFRMRRGGYNAVSFRDLASDINIKSSSVHYHFPTKEVLAVALVERYSERFFELLKSEADGAKTPEEVLKAYSATCEKALVVDKAVCLCIVLGAEMPGLPQLLQDSVRRFFDANIDWVERALPNTYPDALRNRKARAFVAAHQGAIVMAIGLGDLEIFRGISEDSLRGVLPSKPNIEAL